MRSPFIQSCAARASQKHVATLVVAEHTLNSHIHVYHGIRQLRGHALDESMVVRYSDVVVLRIAKWVDGVWRSAAQRTIVRI